MCICITYTHSHYDIDCDSTCSEGLMRCTGSSDTDCCVAFEEDGTCKTDLNCNQSNFVANEQNNYTCGKYDSK